MSTSTNSFDLTQAIPLETLRTEEIGLGHLGMKFPLGIWMPNGQRLRDFTLNPYNGHHDLSLGQLEDEHNTEDSGRWNRIHEVFLPEMIGAIAGYPLTQVASWVELPPPVLINHFYLADVITLILLIRLRVQGNEIALNGTCPCSEQFKIRGDVHGYHLLDSVMVRTLPKEFTNRPLFRIDLEDGFTWEGERQMSIYLEPPRFGHIQDLAEDLLPLDVRLLFACSVYPKITPRSYWQLSPIDLEIIRDQLDNAIHFGPDRSIEMDCPKCSLQWDQPLEYGGAYENFYCPLLCAPRMSREPGGTEAYLDEITFALSYGEDVSMSREDVLKMSPKSRNRQIEKVSEQRRKQKEAMDKSNAEARSKSKRR